MSSTVHKIDPLALELQNQISKNILENIKEIKKVIQLKESEIAEYIGISRQSFHKLKTGNFEITTHRSIIVSILTLIDLYISNNPSDSNVISVISPIFYKDITKRTNEDYITPLVKLNHTLGFNFFCLASEQLPYTYLFGRLHFYRPYEMSYTIEQIVGEYKIYLSRNFITQSNRTLLLCIASELIEQKKCFLVSSMLFHDYAQLHITETPSEDDLAFLELMKILKAWDLLKVIDNMLETSCTKSRWSDINQFLKYLDNDQYGRYMILVNQESEANKLFESKNTYIRCLKNDDNYQKGERYQIYSGINEVTETHSYQR